MQNKNQKLHNILLEIVERKKHDLVSSHSEFISKSHGILNKFQDDNTFKQAIITGKNVSLIAEIKFASPTSPHLGSKEELLDRAKRYEKTGADAISIITESHFFKGDVAFVSQVKKTVGIPVLQKDFVIDERQIYQAKEIGSDALLLIARLIDEKTLQYFVDVCFDLGIEPVVEINSEEDLEKATKTKTKIIAVNSRDLETFDIDVTRACELIKQIPDTFIKLGFSGINSQEEVEQYKNAGTRGVLVGTSLMRAKNIAEFINSLRALSESPSRRAPALRGVRVSGRSSTSATRKKNNNNVKVKICGIRTLENAQEAIAAGADFLGFNFVPTSKRYIDPKNAKKIIDAIRGSIKIVGIFKNQPVEEVNKIAEVLDLDFVQLHGEENEAYMRQINKRIIKKYDIKSDFEINKQNAYTLIDREVQGEGKMVDLEKAKKIVNKYPTFFSGGLTSDNVAEVVKKVKPFAVDVAGGVETNGKIDNDKMKRFIRSAKEVLV